MFIDVNPLLFSSILLIEKKSKNLSANNQYYVHITFRYLEKKYFIYCVFNFLPLLKTKRPLLVPFLNTFCSSSGKEAIR